MPTRRVLRSVLKGFLGTYTSRDTDWDGYWLFGFLSGLPDISIDLLGDGRRRSDGPSENARVIAIRAFAEQLVKHAFPEARVKRAQLSIATPPIAIERMAGGKLRTGHELTFTVTAATDREVTYEASFGTFVAPHDPSLESRSTKDEPRWVL